MGRAVPIGAAQEAYMTAKILAIKSAPYGRYDTEVLALLDSGTLSESVLCGAELPADLAVGQTRQVTVYRGLVETIGHKL